MIERAMSKTIIITLNSYQNNRKMLTRRRRLYLVISKLTNINWHVSVPRAKAVAIVADGEWFQFENHGGSNWKAKFSLDKYRGKNTKVTLSANFEGADESKFSTLLEYLLE
jgi:hypothetical protein